MNLKLLKLKRKLILRFSLYSVCLFAVSVLITSCCKSFCWPPPVENASDVMNLDPSVTWIRARNLPDDDIYSLSTRKNIEILDFWGGWVTSELRLTDKGLKNLADINLPKLDRLELGYCDHISDKGLYYISQMDQIKSLYFIAFSNFSSTGICYLANMANIQSVCFDTGTAINDEDLKCLSKMNLELLTIHSNGGVTNKGLECVSNMTKLKSFYVYGDCDKVTDEGLDSLSKMKQLKILALPCNPNITDMVIVRLKQALPDCDIKIDRHSDEKKCPTGGQGNLN